MLLEHHTNGDLAYGVKMLYRCIRNETEPMVSHIGTEAVCQLCDLSTKGDSDAKQALTRLAAAPDLHPHLQGIIRDHQLRT